MFTKKKLCMSAPVLLLAGCFASLHPLYQEADLVTLPELRGRWADDDSIWIFEPAGKSEYRLTYVEDGCPVRFQVRTLELDGLLFWDLYPEPAETRNEFYRLHLVPAHTFALLDLQGDRLQVKLPAGKWLAAKLEDEPDSLAHEKLDDVIVLTASTSELQEFVRRHSPQIFGETLELTRLRD